MSNIRSIHGGSSSAVGPKSSKPRKQRQKKISAAEISRTLQAAHYVGLTVYGFTIEGGAIKVITKPEASTQQGTSSEADAWFASRG